MFGQINLQNRSLWNTELSGVVAGIASAALLLAELRSLVRDWNTCTNNALISNLGMVNIKFSVIALLTTRYYWTQPEHKGCTRASLCFFGTSAVTSAAMIIIQSAQCLNL